MLILENTRASNVICSMTELKKVNFTAKSVVFVEPAVVTSFFIATNVAYVCTLTLKLLTRALNKFLVKTARFVKRTYTLRLFHQP